MTPDHRQNPKLLWGISGGLIIVLVAVFSVSQFLTTTPETVPEHQADALPAAHVKEATSEPVLLEAETTTLIEENILKEAVPENESLAKEEVAKLEDIQTQLTDQEKTLQQQHADADALIELKEQQIKLLEAQLAQP
jgi:hypothetical protein